VVVYALCACLLVCCCFCCCCLRVSRASLAVFVGLTTHVWTTLGRSRASGRSVG